MYRAFAPFFEAVRGDRRVTGTAQGERGRLERGRLAGIKGAWVFLSTAGEFFFFIAVMGDRRMTADVKAALYGIEFSRESNAVSIRWNEYVPLRRQILSRIRPPSALYPPAAWSCPPAAWSRPPAAWSCHPSRACG